MFLRQSVHIILVLFNSPTESIYELFLLFWKVFLMMADKKPEKQLSLHGARAETDNPIS